MPHANGACLHARSPRTAPRLAATAVASAQLTRPARRAQQRCSPAPPEPSAPLTRSARCQAKPAASPRDGTALRPARLPSRARRRAQHRHSGAGERLQNPGGRHHRGQQIKPLHRPPQPHNAGLQAAARRISHPLTTCRARRNAKEDPKCKKMSHFLGWLVRGWESWGCVAWRRDSSAETSLQLFST